MKILGINGSPRNKGNTSYLVDLFLKEIDKKNYETEQINLENYEVAPCLGCYYCVDNKECKIDDDFAEIFKKMIEADALIIGSPVYHSAVTGRLKALLNRSGFLGRWVGNEMKEDNYDWKGTAFSGTVAAPITVARRAGQNFTFAELLLWFTANDLIVVGSNYWNMSVAGKGGAVDADQDEEAEVILKHLAKNIDYILTKLNS